MLRRQSSRALPEVVQYPCRLAGREVTIITYPPVRAGRRFPVPSVLQRECKDVHESDCGVVKGDSRDNWSYDWTICPAKATSHT